MKTQIGSTQRNGCGSIGVSCNGFSLVTLAKQVNLICTLVRTVIVFSALIMRFQYQRCLHEVINELSHIEVNYFNRVSIKPKRYWRLNLLLYGKFAIWISITSYATFAILQQCWLGRLFEAQIFFVFINFINMQEVSAIFHYVVLWHICKRYHMINDKLLAIFHMTTDITELLHFSSSSSSRNIFAKDLAVELSELSATHAKLTRLLAHMNDKFKFKLLMVVLSFFVNYVAVGYYAVLLASIDYKDWNTATMLISISIYLINLFGLLLLMMISEDITQLSVNMSNILQQFVGLPSVGKYFERNSEMLSLQLSECEITVNIFGFFDINRRTAFAILVQVSLYTIFLIQTDYKNLYFEKPKDKTEF